MTSWPCRTTAPSVIEGCSPRKSGCRLLFDKSDKVELHAITTAMLINMNRLAAHSEHGATYTSLPTPSQMALAAAAPLSLAMFRISIDGGEIRFVDVPIMNAYPQGLTSDAVRKTLSTARTLIYTTLWNKLTSGHAYKMELLAVRKTTALILNANNHSSDLMASANPKDPGCPEHDLLPVPAVFASGGPQGWRCLPGERPTLGSVLQSNRSILTYDEFDMATRVNYRKASSHWTQRQAAL